eukprot:353583-Chlamydomonas_euryale.AAC.3
MRKSAWGKAHDCLTAASWPAGGLACSLARLLACLPACLPVWPAYLPACTYASLPDCLPGINCHCPFLRSSCLPRRPLPSFSAGTHANLLAFSAASLAFLAPERRRSPLTQGARSSVTTNTAGTRRACSTQRVAAMQRCGACEVWRRLTRRAWAQLLASHLDACDVCAMMHVTVDRASHFAAAMIETERDRRGAGRRQGSSPELPCTEACGRGRRVDSCQQPRPADAAAAAAAQAIGLKREKEPAIWDAIRFGTVLENVDYDARTRAVDFDSDRLTENTRICYPIEVRAEEGNATHAPPVGGAR